jgi:hypothetical protein
VGPDLVLDRGDSSYVALRRLSEDLGVTGSLSEADLEVVFRGRSSSSRSSLLRDFFRAGSFVDSEERLLGVASFDSPLRREDPAAERESGSLDFPVILFHIAFQSGYGGWDVCFKTW